MIKTFASALILFTGVLASKATPINPIVGDQSYIMKYGVAPTEATNDHQRIAAHLEYAEFVLRTKDVSTLSPEQIAKRTHLLDLLHEYWTRDIFPRNDDHMDARKPCFIDHEGTICAVGYLIEQTAGHDVAELISERFLYGEIMDMNDPLVINWIEECGLTREECAVIQPTYNRGFARTYNRLSYGVSYRVNDLLYHSIRFEHQSKRSQRRGYNPYSPAYGFQFDWLNHGSFSAGVLYTAQLRNTRLRKIIKTIEIMPEYFLYNSRSGMNVRPGFQFTRTWKRVSLGAGYSYAIPIVNESAYGAGRHDFTLRVGFDFSGLELPKRPTKPTENPADKPAG